MTSHELAKQLLELPDKRIMYWDYEWKEIDITKILQTTWTETGIPGSEEPIILLQD